MPSKSVTVRALIVICIPLLLMVLFRLQLNTRAGHMDEYDYLFVGKILLAGGHWPSHTYIFGWDLNWILLAWGDLNLGGIAGSRRIATVLGILSIAGMYAFVFFLWRNRTIALLSALLLSFEAAHLYSSSLATYDIISFTFFVWSLPALILTCQTTQYRTHWTCTAALLLIAAVLSKYTTMIYLPIIAAIVLFHAPKQAAIGIMLITTALAAYAWTHFDQLQVLYKIQISGAHAANAPKSEIVMRSTNQLLALVTFTLLSAIYALVYRRKELVRILCLFMLGLPLFTYHLLGQNVISLNKHLLYSSLFLIPIMAWGIQQILINSSVAGLRYTLASCIIVFFGVSNYHQLKIMKNSYPDVQSVLPFTNHIQAKDTILSEDPYLFRYLLYDKVSQSQINETAWLDNNLDGIYEHRDVQQAIWGQKFSYVFLNDQQHAKDNERLRNMLQYRGYVTLLNKTYQLETLSGAKRTGQISLHARNNATITMLEDD